MIDALIVFVVVQAVIWTVLLSAFLRGASECDRHEVDWDASHED